MMTSQLENVKNRLLCRRQDLVQQQSQLRQKHDRSSTPTPFTEQSIASQERDSVGSRLHACGEEIDEIDTALRRIEEGVYGTCKHCGLAIAPLRLAELPQVSTCAACAT